MVFINPTDASVSPNDDFRWSGSKIIQKGPITDFRFCPRFSYLVIKGHKRRGVSIWRTGFGAAKINVFTQLRHQENVPMFRIDHTSCSE